MTKRRPFRAALTVFTTVFLVLTGAGVSFALWSTSAQVNSTATTAVVGVSQTILTPFGLDTSYSSSALKAAAIVTVNNTSTRNGTATVSINALSATAAALPGAVAVEAAVVANAAACTTTSTLTSPVTGVLSTTASITLSTAVNASSSVNVCVRTSMTSANVTTHAGKSLVGRVSSAIAVGTWTGSSAVQQFAQSVGTAAVVYPQLVCDDSSPNTGTFRWSPPSYDNNSVYKLYINDISVPPTGANGWNPYVQLTTANVPEATFPAGTASVRVTEVRGGTEVVIGIAQVVLGANPSRTYTCGAVVGSTSTPTPTPTPTATFPPSNMTCSGNGTNYIQYLLAPNAGHQGQTVYKVYIGGTYLYDFTNGYSPQFQFYSSGGTPVVTAALFGSGLKAVEVRQSVANGPYVTAGTGVINIAAGTNNLTCG